MTTNPLLDAALAAAERGWHVFPLVAGSKVPALHGTNPLGCQQRSPTPGRLPRRIQRRRTRGWRTPAGAVYVGRPSKWGNPFKIGSPSGLARVPAVTYPDREWEYEGRISADGMRHDYYHPGGGVTVCHIRHMTPAESVQCYRALVTGGGWPLDWMNSTCGYPTVEQIRAELAGRDLVCWCLPDQPCHADVLLDLANRPDGRAAA